MPGGRGCREVGDESPPTNLPRRSEFIRDPYRPSLASPAVSRISIIIPTLDEAERIGDTLARLAPFRARGCEVIVADGGSRDETRSIAAPLADRLVVAPRGRATQMNAGARAASGTALLFLHADSALPADADRLILDGLATGGKSWGRFDVRLTGRHPLLRVVERLMNWRSRATGICTGDQGLFVTRARFEAAGGFPEIALMEDVALSRALKCFGRPLCLAQPIITSSRRWERNGVLRTVLLMWRLRLAYFFGANPERLARTYENPPHPPFEKGGARGDFDQLRPW
ncbi:MAG: TIGR04283 family arsenosugar biosynthesis glycosyltransferase [Betaproteobacteria bacterium]|nr:TIGR04283 family arsenosugar biosynthesis glycosyltransferase [Betaproteobacteria bacterium]